MLTPQDIQEKEFSKAMFGGYDMAAVDDFLEELGNDYTALYKDNSVLKGKLKVLVEKVEEYRATEDSMRLALSSAQKMADDLMAEAQEKCRAMVAEAEQEAAAVRAGAERDMAAESARLNDAKRETGKFIETAKKLIARFGEALDRAGEEFDFTEADFTTAKQESAAAPAAQPAEKAAAPDPGSMSIEEFVQDVMQGSAAAAGADDLDDTRRVPDIDDTKIWTEEDEETTPRPKFKFSDLQFGKNVNKDN